MSVTIKSEPQRTLQISIRYSPILAPFVVSEHRRLFNVCRVELRMALNVNRNKFNFLTLSLPEWMMEFVRWF